MSIIALKSSDLLRMWYEPWPSSKRTYTFIPRKLRKGTTYVMMFSTTIDQVEKYTMLTKHPRIKIIYKSELAVNYVHPGPPRIFAVVFEVE